MGSFGEFIQWFDNLVLEHSIEPSFNTLWGIWEGMYRVFSAIISVLYVPFNEIAEETIKLFFNLEIDVPFGALCLADFITTPWVHVLLVVAFVAFVFKVVKDIVNPFN